MAQNGHFSKNYTCKTTFTKYFWAFSAQCSIIFFSKLFEGFKKTIFNYIFSCKHDINFELTYIFSEDFFYSEHNRCHSCTHSNLSQKKLLSDFFMIKKSVLSNIIFKQLDKEIQLLQFVSLFQTSYCISRKKDL